jgi:hypothetical protein
MDSKDRRAELLKSATFNGIDFVEISTDDETVLRVHFLNDVSLQGTLSAIPTIDGGETIRSVAVNPVNDATDWEFDGDHVVLRLTVAAPGDFSNYTLTLHSAALDPFFASAIFSFKARCPSDLDCQATTPPCPPVQGDVPPIDYLSKDFLSFRQALLDFSSLRYPQWQERSEADFGMMFAEALSAMADDLSYTQDRVATEATLETATQRRSVVRQARLVDYEPRPATASSVLLQFDVATTTNSLTRGLLVSAQGPDGTPVSFETGTGLDDKIQYSVNSKWNRQQPRGAVGIQPYFWDDSQRCLVAGSTEMWVLGTGFGFFDGQILLIDTTAESPADPPIREFVHLVIDPTQTYETSDPLFPGPPAAPTPVTHIVWRQEDALKFNHDLTTDSGGNPRTVIAGNVIPATQGVTVSQSETFAIPPRAANQPDMLLAIARTGPNDSADTPSIQWLYTLRDAPVAWLQPDDPEALPTPEIRLTSKNQETDSADPTWQFLHSLLDADDFDNAFTLDAARFSRLGRNSIDGSIQYDYDGDGGDTIRFGDGTFGDIPADGQVFDVTYRVGGGDAGNVAADAITQVSTNAAKNGVVAVTNPLPAAGGDDPEPLDRVRRLAPQQFRAVQFRAVRPEDYQAAAETLPWVQRAGTVFRWTGSWLTVFTTADPRDSEEITIGERTELINLLNRYRMAGYESYVPDAQYVSLDLVVELCALPDAFRGDVDAAVLAKLSANAATGSVAGFFDPDHFTFGQPLERSDLEAAVQSAAGVAGVTCVLYRIRNRTAGLAEMPDVVAVGPDEIIRCDNDPSLPEHGSLKITIRGGK